MANPDPKQVSIKNASFIELDKKKVGYPIKITLSSFPLDDNAQISDYAKLKADVNAITAHILSLPNEIDNDRIGKIRLKLEKGYYNKKWIIEIAANSIANSFLCNQPDDVKIEHVKKTNTTKPKQKIKKQKHPSMKELVEEFAGIWEGKEPEKSSVELAKELRIKASSRDK